MATTVFAIAVTEVLAPGFTDPAGHRLADTLIGAAIAVLIGYVLFPTRGAAEEDPPTAPRRRARREAAAPVKQTARVNRTYLLRTIAVTARE